MNNHKLIKTKFNTTKLLVIFIIIAILTLACYAIYNSNNKRNNKNKVITTTKNVSDWVTPKGKANSILFYENNITNSLYPVMKNDSEMIKLSEEDNLVGQYLCSNKECKYYSIGDNYIVIKDGDYYYYNINKNKAKKSKLIGNYNDVKIINNNDKIYGLILDKNDRYGFYNYKEEKQTIDCTYNNITSDDSIKFGYVIASYNSNDQMIGDNYLINYNSGKIKLEATNEKVGSVCNDTYCYFYKTSYEDNSSEVITKSLIYNKDFELLFNGEKYSLFGISNSSNIAISNDSKTYLIYNKKGNLIKKSKNYDEIKLISKNYIVVIDNDNYLKLIDFDGNIITKFLKMTDNYVFNKLLSGYQTIDNKEGIYLFVENKDIDYGTNGAALKYYYIPSTKDSGVVELDGIQN